MNRFFPKKDWVAGALSAREALFWKRLCVFTGLLNLITPDLSDLNGRKATTTDMEEALKTWARNAVSSHYHVPHPLQISLFKKMVTLPTLGRTSQGTVAQVSCESVSLSDGTSYCTVNTVVYKTVHL